MVKKERLLQIRNTYERILLHDIAPFWLNYSLDKSVGGYFNYLDRDGSVLSTDKDVWLQNRELWFFSKMYQDIEKKPEYLEAATLGYQFVKEHCFDTDGSMFFQVDQFGNKLRKRRYWYTETFGVLGLSEYARATHNKEAEHLASRTYDVITDLYYHPEKRESKVFTETRQTKSLATPMLLMSTTQVMRQLKNNGSQESVYDQVITSCLEEIRSCFLHREHKVLLEMVASDGSLLDTPEGRTINPGHAIETAWFLMHEGLHRGDRILVEDALQILMWSLHRGWDETYGGLFSFVDFSDKPSDHVEWDMKYWWPQTEAMYALLLAYVITKEDTYLSWYDDVHDWTLAHFPDYEFGEWYGYLHRDGSVCLPNKGSHWKGTLHIPRLLIQGIQLIDSCLSNTFSGLSV
jgi:N-acylglucosamine 2-epimerase